MGTSSRRRGRGSRDVRRNAGAARTTVRPRNPKIHPRPSREPGESSDVAWSTTTPRRVEIPVRTAPCQARVACHAPHSRKNSRNLVVGARKRPSSVVRKGPLTRYFRWWRGQDLNLRPSGYEVLGGCSGSCHLVPECAVDLRFRVPARHAASRRKHLVTARPLEDPLEVRPGGHGRDRCWRAARSRLRRATSTVSAVARGLWAPGSRAWRRTRAHLLGSSSSWSSGLHEPRADITHEWKDCSISAG